MVKNFRHICGSIGFLFLLSGCGPSMVAGVERFPTSFVQQDDSGEEESGAQTPPVVVQPPTLPPPPVGTPPVPRNFSSFTQVGGKVEYRNVGDTTSNLAFIEYVPDNYATRTDWPLVIHFHGRNGHANVDAGDGPIDRIYNGRHFPAIVLMPELIVPNNGPELCAFVDFALARYKVDAKRVYLTGVSTFGYTVWKTVETCAAKITAVAPMATTGPISLETAQATVREGISTWLFIANDDFTFSADRGMNWLGDALAVPGRVRDGNPTAISDKTASLDANNQWIWLDGATSQRTSHNYAFDVRYTYYKDGGHWYTWARSFANDDVWEWMFQKTRP